MRFYWNTTANGREREQNKPTDNQFKDDSWPSLSKNNVKKCAQTFQNAT